MGFFDGSLLDEINEITKDKFETVVGLGASHHEVRVHFCLGLLIWSGEDIYGLDLDEWTKDPKGEKCKKLERLLDKWCLEQYRVPYMTAYHLIQERTIKKFENLMVDLGIRGNPSAIAIANEVIRKKEASSIVTINYVNQLPLEGEDSKKDDEEQ